MIEFLQKAARSKTVIVNSLTVVAGTLGYWAGHEVIANYPEVVAILVSALGVVNVGLRFVTVIPLSEK